MIKLKLLFGKEAERSFEIKADELLSDAVKRALDGIPLGEFKAEDAFNVVVNGHIIESDFWDKVKLKEADDILVSPKLRGGDGGQFFKQALIITIAAVATVYLGPQAGYGVWGALGVAAITIGSTLILNALIPPPVPDIGGPGGGSVDSSQMYSISGQSNQMKRLGIVPKVYGSHRMFPCLAVTPYTELAVSTGIAAHYRIENIEYEAKKIGTFGNAITIKYINGASAGSEVVAVSGKNITITYPVGVSTANQIITKIKASAAASALVNVNTDGNGDTVQTFQGSQTLIQGEEAGETVQFLYAIYDFGLGTNVVSDLKIGDTPLTTDSFRDFDARFVDPMKPSVALDEYDDLFQSDFQYYRSKRKTAQLSLNLINGDEFIQLTDVNVDTAPQEILLDFVCQRGLFGYSSTGKTGVRNIKMEIHFALVGTSDWHGYNDEEYVDDWMSVGGIDTVDFNQYLQPLNSTDPNPYYTFTISNYSSYNSPYNVKVQANLKYNQKKMLMKNDERWTVGSKLFFGKTLMGVIKEVNLLSIGTEIVLDRNIPVQKGYYEGPTTLAFPGYTQIGKRAAPVPTLIPTPYPHYEYVEQPVTNLQTATGMAEFRSNGHETGTAIMVGDRQSAVYGNFRFSPKLPGQYQVRVRRINAYGSYNTQVGDDITWGAITTSYKTAPVLTTKRHTFLELRIKATNQLNGNIQNLSGIASSVLPVYDPITETWSRRPTNNPAWIFCDLLTGEVNKRPIAIERVHLPSLLEWADYCDEIPIPPSGHTYLEPRFQCNFILDYETTLQGALNQVSNAAQANLNIIDGKHGVLIDRFKETPVQIFTTRNSRDFSSTRLYGPRPHGVNVKYIDPQLDWEVKEVIAYDNGYSEENATELDDLTSFACTNYEQAWRFGRYMIAQNKLRQETISLLVDFENIICSRGDYVQVTQDVMQVGGVPARVRSFLGTVVRIDDSLDINPDLNYGYVYRSQTGVISTSTCTPISANEFDLDGPVPAIGDLIVIGEVGRLVYDCIVKSITPNDDMSASIQLIEKADEIFDYESSTDLPVYDPQLSLTSRPDYYPPKAVLSLEMTDNYWDCSTTTSGYDYFVELLWDVPPGSVYEYFEIWVNDGTGYKVYDKVNAKMYRYTVDQLRLGYQHSFKVVAVAASGKKLQLIEMPEVITTPNIKAEPPGDVLTLNMSITNQVLQLSWEKLPDCDISQYSIRYSPDINDVWESSIPLATVAKDVNTASVQARTGVYLIKAVDFAGNTSVNAAVGLTTIPNLFDLNIIETLNDAPEFDGGLDRTVKLGDAIILDEEVSGDADTMKYYEEGYYTSNNILDLGDVYTVRLQAGIRADGYRFGELMSEWEHLADVESLNTAGSEDWNVEVEYRATDIFNSMADWEHLSDVDHINYGAGIGFTEWRPIPTIGDATGRIFQFRIKLKSYSPNVTPRLFDSTIRADMPDRVDSFENIVSSAFEGTVVTYEQVFKGPGTTPNVQVSVDNGETGDYWEFDYKTLEGLSIRFYDKNGFQVSRQFDLVAKGYGRRHTTTI